MNKRKLFTLALSICMIAILAVGGTLAYMFDTDHQVNVFTAGDVGMNLTEAEVVEDEQDNLIDAGTRFDDNEEGETISQTYDLHPNMTVHKDPTISIDAGSKPCYVGAKVTVSGDLAGLIGMDVTNQENQEATILNIQKLVSGGLVGEDSEYVGIWNGFSFAFENETAVVCQEVEGEDWVLYVFIKDAQYPVDEDGNFEDIVLFDTLTIPADYTNEDMEKLNGMVIDVKAYAVQAAGFEYLGDQRACFVALTEAFGDDWPGDSGFVDGDKVEEIAENNPNAGNLRVNKPQEQ